MADENVYFQLKPVKGVACLDNSLDEELDRLHGKWTPEPGAQQHAHNLIQALRRGNGATAAELAVTFPAARPINFASGDLANIIAHMRPHAAAHRPACAAAARSALTQLMEAGTSEPIIKRKLCSSALLTEACKILAYAAPAPDSLAPESRALLMHTLRANVCRAPLTKETARRHLVAAEQAMIVVMQRGYGPPIDINVADEMEGVGANQLLKFVKRLPKSAVERDEVDADMEAAPGQYKGRRWRFNGQIFDGRIITGAGPAAEMLINEPPGAVTVAMRAIADSAASLQDRTEALLLLSGMLNATILNLTRNNLMGQLRQQKQEDLEGLAAGLARWLQEQRSARDGAPDERAFADPLRTVIQAVGKASEQWRVALLKQAVLAPWVPAAVEVCVACNKSKDEVPQPLRRCAGCMQVSYCSQQCQKNHWPAHKAACKAFQRKQKV